MHAQGEIITEMLEHMGGGVGVARWLNKGKSTRGGVQPHFTSFCTQKAKTGMR